MNSNNSPSPLQAPVAHPVVHCDTVSEVPWYFGLAFGELQEVPAQRRRQKPHFVSSIPLPGEI